MILDKLLQFDPAGTLASTIVTAGVNSTNTLDLANPRDLGVVAGHKRIVVVFTIGTVFAAAGGAASLVIEIHASDAVSSGFVLLLRSDEIAKASLLANSVIRLPLPEAAANPELTAIPRYLKCIYKAITNDFTSGTFECDLVVDPQANTPPTYAAGVTVSN